MSREAVQAERPAPMDFGEALDRVAGDEHVLKELLGLFREHFPARIAQIEAAIRAGNGDAVRDAGLGLRGSAAGLGLIPIREASSALEAAGRGHHIAAAARLLYVIKEEFARLERYLEEAAPADPRRSRSADDN